MLFLVNDMIYDNKSLTKLIDVSFEVSIEPALDLVSIPLLYICKHYCFLPSRELLTVHLVGPIVDGSPSEGTHWSDGTLPVQLLDLFPLIFSTISSILSKLMVLLFWMFVGSFFSI